MVHPLMIKCRDQSWYGLAQPMRDDITMQCHLSLAESIPRMIPTLEMEASCHQSCDVTAIMVFGELQGSPFPYGPEQVKLPAGQVDLDRFFFFIWYKQIEEFLNSWSRASDDFEKRRALELPWRQDLRIHPGITAASALCGWVCVNETKLLF